MIKKIAVIGTGVIGTGWIIRCLAHNKKVIAFDQIEGIDKDKYLEFSSIAKSNLLENEKIKKINLKRTSPACIIYTSGTGGNPKGVILSHGGILNNIEGAQEILKPALLNASSIPPTPENKPPTLYNSKFD